MTSVRWDVLYAALLAALALACVPCDAAQGSSGSSGSSSPSYVLGAAAQAGSAQPYPRGCQASAIQAPNHKMADAVPRSARWVITACFAPAASPPHPLVARGSPRPRLLAPTTHRTVSLTIGSGAGAVQYQFSVDTGSALLEISCQSAAAQANCDGRALAGSYELTPAHTITSPAACAATGINCYVPGAAGLPGSCFLSQGVRRGRGRSCWIV